MKFNNAGTSNPELQPSAFAPSAFELAIGKPEGGSLAVGEDVDLSRSAWLRDAAAGLRTRRDRDRGRAREP